MPISCVHTLGRDVGDVAEDARVGRCGEPGGGVEVGGGED